MKRNTRLALSILVGAIVIAALGIFAANRLGLLGEASNPARTGQGHLPALQGQAYGAWILTCGTTPQTANRCALVIRAVEAKTKQIVMSLVVTRGPKGNPILVTNVPPVVMIPAGVTIKPENGTARSSGFQVCNRQRCEAIFLIDETLHKELAAGGKIGVRFVMAGNKPFGLKLPIKGFEQAFAAWSARSPAPPQPAQPATAAGAQTPAPAQH